MLAEEYKTSTRIFSPLDGFELRSALGAESHFEIAISRVHRVRRGARDEGINYKTVCRTAWHRAIGMNRVINGPEPNNSPTV